MLKKTYIFLFVVCVLSSICFEWLRFLMQDEKMSFLENRVSVVSDQVVGGHSVIQKDTVGLAFRYTLNNGVDYPWANLSFKCHDTPFHDISLDDKLVIRLKANEGKVLPIIFHTYLSGDSIPEDELDYQVSETDLNVTNEFSEHVLDFASINTSPWWIKEMGVKGVGHADFSKIAIFKIASCRIIKRGVEDHVVIKYIKVRRSWFWQRVVFYFLLGLSVLSFILYQLKKWEKKREKIIHFKPSEIEENKINYIQFLSENYTDSEVSLDSLSSHFGVNAKEISKSIKEETGLTFKQLLNSFRIEEAKRLLIETDQRSSEIAFSIGYENVTHFNRVFKDYLSQSPSEFRKNSLRTDL